MTTLADTYPELKDSDLPLWMRQARQNTDWGILITVALCLLAAWPFWLQSGLPTTTATLNHAFMVADYTEVFREGVLYPRWTAAALEGYGAPIPHYYPPGTAYLTGGLNILFLDDTVLAIRVMYTLALCMAGAMTYAFVMRFAGAAVAVLAAVLYVYSPYVGHVVPHTLGDLPGMLVLALYPALLWALHRLLTIHRAFDFMMVALINAAFVLVMPPAVPVAAGIAAMMIGWHLLTGRRKVRVLLVIFAGVFAAGVSAFYWIPAVLDRSLVRWVPPPYDLPTYTLTLVDLLSPMQRLDLSAFARAPQLTLGLGLVLFAVLGIVAAWLNRTGRGLVLTVLVGTLVLLVCAVQILPTETMLLGPLSLGMAIIGAQTLRLQQVLPDQYSRIVLPVALIVALMLAYPVWLAPAWEDVAIDLSPTAQISYEQQQLGAAVLPPGEPLPSTLDPGIAPDVNLINSYTDDADAVQRFNLADNRMGRRVSFLTAQSHEDRFLVTTDDILLTLQRASFAGWQARVNGAALSVQAQPGTGLLQIDLPNTQNAVLTVRMGTTATRRGAWLLTWVSLGLLVVGAVARLRRQARSYQNNLLLLTVQEARLLLVISLGFLAAVLIFARPNSPYTLHARPGSGIDNAIDYGARTVFGMEVMAYATDTNRVRPGGSVDVMLAWRNASRRPLPRNYQLSVFLQQPDNTARWLYIEPHTPGGLPTRRWPSEGYMRTDYTFTIPSSLPSGPYQVGVEVYDCLDDCTLNDRVSFTDAGGQLVGQRLILPAVIDVIR